jgi:hypothetical protein
VLPPKRCDVSEETIPNNDPLRTEMLDSTVEIDRVPMHDCGGDEAQTGRSEALVLESAVADFALTVKEDRTPQRIASLAFVKPGMAAPTQVGIGQPLQSEQGAFDAAERPQGARERIASACRSELAQNDRRHDRTNLD